MGNAPILPLLAAGLLLAAAVAAALRWAAGPATQPPWMRQIVLGGVVAGTVLAFGSWAIPRHGPEAPSSDRPGDLRSDGLRLSPRAPFDARDVPALASFEHADARELYDIAHEIPEVLSRLYCWCGCIARGRHRSALACFEGRGATACGVCRETALIAWREVRRGVTDPAEIQRAVDLEWAPVGRRESLTHGAGRTAGEGT